MKTFPMFLRMEGRRVVIVGGGEQAAQKARLMLKTEARVELLAPALEDELRALRDADRIVHRDEAVTPAMFAGAALVFVATGCPGLDASVHALAVEAGVVVNVVDQPELCEAITPSIVDRSPVVVAIGTEGTAPVLARQIKTRVEGMLEPRLGDLAALAGRMRAAAAQRLGPRARRDLWRWVFDGPVRDAHARGAEREAAALLKEAIATGEAGSREGSVALVGAGPGSADLITLRGVRRLQEADVIFYDRLVDPEVLELARRDAERVHVGKAPGCHAWPQDRIDAMLVAAAKRGQRVVRLKCGDPGVFGRAAEELAALRDADIPVEIVPGVTSASAAAASAGGVLTERGVVDTLVLATGHDEAEARAPAWLPELRPGVRVALYMGVSAAGQVSEAIARTPFAREVEVQVVANAQRADEVVLACAPGALAETLAAHGIRNTAIIFLTRPKRAAAAAVRAIA